MHGAGSALMGIGSARGADRAIKAAELAVSSPLLEASVEGAHGVLLSIQGSSNLALHEIHEASSLVQEVVHPEANIIFGTVIDDTLGDEVRVTVIAAGFDDTKKSQEVANERGRRGIQTSAFDDEGDFGTDVDKALSGEILGNDEHAERVFSVPAPTEDAAFVTGDDADLDIPDFLK